MKIEKILDDVKKTGMTYQEIAIALSTETDKINPCVIYKWHEGVAANQILIDRVDRVREFHKKLRRQKKIQSV